MELRVSSLSGVVNKMDFCIIKKHIFNANDIQDGLWEFYQEDIENGLEWEEFVIANAIGYLEDIINSEMEAK